MSARAFTISDVLHAIDERGLETTAKELSLSAEQCDQISQLQGLHGQLDQLEDQQEEIWTRIRELDAAIEATGLGVEE